MVNGYDDIDIREIDWSDVEPVPQDDGPDPLVAIQYDPEYRYLMDLFRGVIRLGELSHRVLILTARILDENASNYTVWQYRRECIKALNIDINVELDFMDKFAEDNPKSYQIWYHRRALVEVSNNPSRELEFCNKVFEVDAKNYHAWAHRQWVIKTYGLWDGELEYVDSLLSVDMRNNSAWNQRWFVVHNNPIGVSDDLLLSELKYVSDALDVMKQNESAWNYLRGLYNHHRILTDDIFRICDDILKATDRSNIFALSLVAEIKLNQGVSVSSVPLTLLDEESSKYAIECFSLLSDFDPIRRKYWKSRVDEVRGILWSTGH